MKKEIISFRNAPGILAAASVVGKHESEGPLGPLFDLHDSTDRFGKETWEQSESEMQRISFNLALTKANLREEELNCIFAGDLVNQCTSSAYGLLDFDLPYFGIYGACSTAAEGLILASSMISTGIYEKAAVTTSSHNCTAERQFRFPIEYGGQRTPSSQWTVTGAATFLLSSGGGDAYLTEALPGRATDYGITDLSNMGAAMAPAAIDTLTRYFRESGMTPSRFDLILTGDLGFEGYSIVLDLMKKEGYDLSENYTDCGLLIYDRSAQDVHAGGSGCGCSAVVVASYLTDLFRKGEIRDVLFLGTGALMSPLTVKQGQSIPGIAHLVRITKERMF